jgi:lipopolysaccharide transport system permease protein
MEFLSCVDIRPAKDLITYKTYADLRAEAERTYLGVAWWLLEPLINMGIYYYVFKVLLDRGTEDFVVFLACGVIPWQWFSGSVQQGSGAIHVSINLVRKVPLNNVAFPIIVVLKNFVRFIVSLIVLFIVIFLGGFEITIYWLAFPALVLIQFLLILGLTIPFSGIVPFFPDLLNLIGHGLRVLFFMSGVFWPIPALAPNMQTLILLNPMALMIKSFRDVLMYQQWPPVVPLLLVVLFSFVMIYVGAFIVSRFNQIYAKRVLQ